MQIVPIRAFDTSQQHGPTCSQSLSSGVARRLASRLEIAGAVYNWVTCLFIAGMVSSQLLGILASSIDKPLHLVFGEDPTLGPYDTGKTNDVPYSDRSLACVRRHGRYEPVPLNDLLNATSMAPVVDSSGASGNGYRIIQRSEATLDSAAYDAYNHSCNMAAATMDNIFSVCASLGYNVTRDNLRIVDGLGSNVTKLILNSLPLLVMPYWDNSLSARYAIPGQDGSACLVHLVDRYENADASDLAIRGVNRSVREMKTAEWLQRPGGHWHNGWYEDLDGMQWYSDMMTTSIAPTLLPTRDRYFDGASGNEIDCSRSTVCHDSVITYEWSSKFVIELDIQESTSIVIYNGTQFGVFLYDGSVIQRVFSRYDWPTAVSNLSITLLIFRWMASLMALHRGYLEGKTALYDTSIGSLSNAASFQVLPILLLPRLTTTLSAFFTVGCAIQGQQAAFSETWFVVYPAITEFVLVYYSLLNTLAKVLRRRVTDALFAPTVMALTGLHFFRWEMAATMGGADNLIVSVVTSDEMEQLSLDQFFRTDIALRLNGGVKSLFAIKLGILALSLLALLFTRPIQVQKDIATSLSGVEKALGVRAGNVAGLGLSSIYEYQGEDLAADGNKVRPFNKILLLNSYEIVRLGCVVYGDKFLITMDDWDRISMLTGLRHLYHLWNHRVVVFGLRKSKAVPGQLEIDSYPQLLRVDAPELQKISVWCISACSLQC